MNVNPIAMQKALSGMNYPASKKDIVERASRNHADREVKEALERLPDKEYDSPAEVNKEASD
ncbi:DUF2795 domain-containing protein [Streptomyces sp. NPDC093600]|uniref:DUF2795 domain-containing protein n=1 Tax=Streptomyces sp. NPDC093600 TaxID=3366047 RepID=UPI00380C68B0